MTWDTSEYGRRRWQIPGLAPRGGAQIGRPGVAQSLSDALGVTGGGIDLALVPSLQPVLALSLDEASAPSGPYRAQGGDVSAAAVGLFSTLGVLNPANSGVDLHLQFMIAGSDVASMAANLRFRSPPVAGMAATGNERFMDDPAGAGPAGQIIEGRIAAIGAPNVGRLNVGNGQHGAGISLVGWVVPPDSDFTIQNTTANTLLQILIQWWEIPRE